ncbi:MAG: hypothetical protein FE835_19425 [Gammaproteobacteria bacterium]|nr:hypothetical protein [Gammaproteobacteria bacterium]
MPYFNPITHVEQRGTVKISRDTRSYQRADRLLKETELVLEATCTACGAN